MGADFKPKDDSPEAQQEAAAKKNNVMSALANVGDNLASGNSYGNYWLKQVNQKQTTQRDAEKERQKQDDPMARQEKAAAYLKNKREMSQTNDRQKWEEAIKDPNSTQAKAFLAMLPEDVRKSGITATEALAQGFDPSKLSEIKARAAVDFDNARRLKGMDLAGDLQKIKATKDATPATEGQINAAGYARRAEQSEGVFDNLGNAGYDRSSGGSAIESYLPEFAQSGELKQQTQAERNFINALLRRESGAAISKDEFSNAEKQYFPRAGDTEEVRAQKKANRDQARQMLKVAAGKAYEQVPLVGGGQGPAVSGTSRREALLAEKARREAAKKTAGK